MFSTVSHEQTMKISTALRKVAKEVEETAKGSSRVAMYSNIADEIRAQAQAIDMLTPIGVSHPAPAK